MNLSRTPLAFALGLLTLSAGCGKKPGGIRARGHVYDAVTGSPLPGIEVVIEQIGGGDRSAATTDKGGRFSLRGKLGVDAPFELKAKSGRYLEAKLATPRLPFAADVRVELLANNIENGFNVPVNGITTKAFEVAAKITLPPPEKPTAPLVGGIDDKSFDKPVPLVEPTPMGWRAVIAPPPEDCACVLEPLTKEGETWVSDPSRAVSLTTWQPKTLMGTVRMQVLEVPGGVLAKGRWVFWPTKPPPYDALAKVPDLRRQGWVFDVK